MKLFLSSLLSTTRRCRALSRQRKCLFFSPGKAEIWWPHYAAIELPVYHQSGAHGYLTLLHHQQQCRSVSSTSCVSGMLSESTGKEVTEDMNKIEVEIVSKENIAPASPTPLHLRTLKLSVLDQMAPRTYTPFVFFYLNNHTTNPNNVVASDQSKQLKHSLSKTLTRFYPFAGKVRDESHIDCNDEGVNYVETRVNYRLSDFLSQPPEDQLIQPLFPQNPESSIGGYVVMIQVNIFSCGGSAIGMCTSHKIIDGNTLTMFLEDWTAAARGAQDVVHPSFIAPSLFPQIPCLSFENPILVSQGNSLTRRFVFDAPTLAALKAKTRLPSTGKEPTRVEIVAALLWKCAAKAASQVSGSYSQRPFNLGLLVNLRLNNCLPKELVGNLIWIAMAQHNLNSEPELHYMVDKVRKCKAEINRDFVEALKGEEGSTRLKKIAELIMNSSDEFLALPITSMCNTGMYELDFGWGKPAWMYYGNQSARNFIALCDTRVGDGIEAMVTLTKQDMAIFEHDTELRSYTSFNPAPL